jgi:ribosomal-protein-alanine N-acetyltransferase
LAEANCLVLIDEATTAVPSGGQGLGVLPRPAGLISAMADPGVWGSRHPGWPAVLGPVAAVPVRPGSGRDGPPGAPSTASGAVGLRPLHRADGRPWREIRIRDRELISRWDATSHQTWAARHTPAMWRAQRSSLRAAARRGEALPFAITVDGAFAGQVTVGGIQRGALRSGWVGYWVDSRLHGRRVATRAVALAVAHAFEAVGLHRVEATIAPANAASRAVVAHLGFRQEGLLRRYLDIDGQWRDHLLYALTVEDLPDDRPPLATLLGGVRPPVG